jgi:hypothetical protein
VVTTVIILAAPTEQNNIQPPANGGASYEKKIQTEQAKKNYILRRFISYTSAKQVSY